MLECEEKPWNCEQCGKVFHNRHAFQRSAKTHCGEKLCECKECRKSSIPLKTQRWHTVMLTRDKGCGGLLWRKAFHCTSSLAVHKSAETRGSPGGLEGDGNELTHSAAFPAKEMAPTVDTSCKHKKSVEACSHLSSFRFHEEKPYDCTECGKTFSLRKFRRPRGVHHGDRPYKCHFLFPSLVYRYERCHAGQKPYECKQCGKAHSGAGYLQVHERIPTDKKPYECKQCGKPCACSSSFRERNRPFTRQNHSEWKAPGKAFTLYSSIRIQRRTHTREKTCECKKCTEGILAPRRVRGQVVELNTGVTHQCEFCEETRKSMCCLHHKRTHSRKKPYECQDCGKALRNYSTLKVHEMTHTGERPYVCSQCGKAFTHSSSVRVHERTHTGEKPYKCTECGKVFAHSSSFRVHERTHTGEKPYECQQCGKAFIYLSSFQVHARTHTGERPYGCKRCGKAFICSSHLQKHERTHWRDTENEYGNT
ncbi:PREDICTED: zinc finger protein 709-like isoform X1 [Dipodomys ordii]|uniref:Zinc finger protein 709-like isoform X1 n=1 Tax=Dipodomys ordii TaxID=10020 RepID=A0A1S3GL88_DIPOR|nr:PREDICTED: zinc finger protein 709-like isoform X1 [Dipodomys ordii]